MHSSDLSARADPARGVWVCGVWDRDSGAGPNLLPKMEDGLQQVGIAYSAGIEIAYSIWSQSVQAFDLKSISFYQSIIALLIIVLETIYKKECF